MCWTLSRLFSKQSFDKKESKENIQDLTLYITFNLYLYMCKSEESYCSLCQLPSTLIYVTFSASVPQTVAVSVIGCPVLI